MICIHFYLYSMIDYMKAYYKAKKHRSHILFDFFSSLFVFLYILPSKIRMNIGLVSDCVPAFSCFVCFFAFVQR